MMSPAENKRAKRRKNKKGRLGPKVCNGPEIHPNIQLDTLGPAYESRAMSELGELNAAELPSGCPLELRCLVCNCESLEQTNFLQDKRGLADGCEEGDNTVEESMRIASQLPWYICKNCKTTRDKLLPANGYESSFVDYLPLPVAPETGETGGVEAIRCSCKMCLDHNYLAELSNKTANTVGCTLALDNNLVVSGFSNLPQHIQSESLKDEVLKSDWLELKRLLHHMYREAGLTLGEALIPHLPPPCQGASSSIVHEQRLKDIVCRLCHQDAHKLYLCLESQVKLFVVEMRLRLLMKVGGSSVIKNNSGSNCVSKPFVCLMLEEYAKLCSAAVRVAPYLEELETNHLKGFKLTWELVNRHLFQSIVYDDPLLHSRLTVKLSKHRLSSINVGTSAHDKCHHDSFTAVAKFDDEMTVLSVLWREAEQLIEAYNQGQAARAIHGLELFHAQWKQLMEAVDERFPVPECQKSFNHTAGLKDNCIRSPSSSPSFLSPLELVSLAEEHADDHVMSLVGAVSPPAHFQQPFTQEGCTGTMAGVTGVARTVACIKNSPYYAKMPRQARLSPNVSSGLKLLCDSYQKPGLDCLTSDIHGGGITLSPPPHSPLTPPPLPSTVSLGEGLFGGGCCHVQQNGGIGRDSSNQLCPLTKCASTFTDNQQPLQQPKSSASLKGGGVGTSKNAGAELKTTSPEAKGGCECLLCSQKYHGHKPNINTHHGYEGGANLSPNLLTGLKSMFAEACGSPSALAAVKQLIQPHFYHAHNSSPPTVPSQNNKATTSPHKSSSFFPEPFDLKLETQGILREQIKLATMGDWDCDLDEARSVLLHHYHKMIVKNHHTATVGPAAATGHYDLPTPLPMTNKFFPPVSLNEGNNPHPSLRGNLPSTPGVCQTCKVEPDGSSFEDEADSEDTNSNCMINNLELTFGKPAYNQGIVIGPADHNGLIPDGYGSLDCSVTNDKHLQSSNLLTAPPSSNISSINSTPATTPSSVRGDLTMCSAGGGSSSSSSLSSMGAAERGPGSHSCCEGHVLDGEEESGADPDDSCSERSSSTSTSNQRESRVCDCCYCEPVVAPVSRNYPEMRDRLRLRLSKKKAEGAGGVGSTCERNDQPLEDDRALEELLKFINGSDEEKSKQRKSKRKGTKRGDSSSANNEQQVLVNTLEKDESGLIQFHAHKEKLAISDYQQPQQHANLPVESQTNCKKPFVTTLQVLSGSAAVKNSVPKTDKQHQNVSSKEPTHGNPERCARRLPQEKQKQPQTQGVDREHNRLLHLVNGISTYEKPCNIITNGTSNTTEETLPQHGKQSFREIARQANGAILSLKNLPALQVSISAVPNKPEFKQDALKIDKINNNNNNISPSGNVGHMNGSLTAKEIISAAACLDTKSTTRSKKSKKKKNGTDDANSPDDIFMPKDIDLENGELDEFEKELEAFKRFCFNSVPLANKEKVHVNLKEIVVKKKQCNNNGVALSNGHKF